MRSREEVPCQWDQYFHIVSECEENRSSEETGITYFKTEKGQKDSGRKGDKVLGRKKAVFQDGSTNPMSFAGLAKQRGNKTGSDDV